MIAEVAGLNQHEWMLLYGDRLADAIREDGVMGGPLSDPMLMEVQRLDCSGPIRQNARRCLHEKLKRRGLGHLLEL